MGNLKTGVIATLAAVCATGTSSCANHFRVRAEPATTRAIAGEPQTRLDSIRQRYQQAVQRGAALKGCLGRAIDPLTFKDIAARRFINRPDWESYLKKKNATANPVIDPAEVYNPAPVTWDDWWKVQAEVTTAAHAKIPLTVELIELWNAESLQGTIPDYEKTGEFRGFDNYATNLSESSALTQEEVTTLENFRLPGVSGPALLWDPAVCLEDLPKDFKLPGERPECKKVWDEAHNGTSDENAADRKNMDANVMVNQWYQDACWPRISLDQANKLPKVCGFFHFIPFKQVPKVVSGILNWVNQDINKKDTDPIALAMFAQQKFIGTHPFVDGNGRVSRWIQDYLTLRAGLPFAYIPEMDHDLSTPPDQYVGQGYDGMEEGLGIMENCFTKYEAACSADEPDSGKLARLQNSACGTL